MINESGKESVDVVISENHFLKVDALIVELVVVVICFARYRIDEFLVKQSKIFRCHYCVGLMVATRQKPTMTYEIFFFALKLQNHVESIDVTAPVDYCERIHNDFISEWLTQ